MIMYWSCFDGKLPSRELPTEFDFSQSFLVQFRAVDGNPAPAVQDGWNISWNHDFFSAPHRQRTVYPQNDAEGNPNGHMLNNGASLAKIISLDA